MIDRTWLSIYAKTHYFRKLLYDWKSNYSIKVQIVNKPNLKIINYVSGFVDSRHNAHFIYFTWLVQQLACFLGADHCYWRNVSYPLNEWLIILYKRPNSEKRDNCIFNTTLSRIQIKNEFEIGYLKERWQSLQSLRRQINNKKDIIYAMVWVNACIILQAFSQYDELEVDLIGLMKDKHLTKKIKGEKRSCC